MAETVPTPHRFRGGLPLDKLTGASGQPVRDAALPDEAVLPLSQHAGHPALPVVKIGERVLTGQRIAAADGLVSATIHASISGTVVAIEDRPVPHPSGLVAPSIVIESDGRDEWAEPMPPLDDYLHEVPHTLRHRIQDAGIVGLGGAVFPTAVKLTAEAVESLHTLVINGAECDPAISCDNALIAERSDDIVAGAQVLMHALQVHECVIAVEDHMTDAAAALGAAIDASGDDRFKLMLAPTVYPEGGERQLLQAISGREVPAAGLPMDIGYVCQNVGTAAAVSDAVLRGRPLIARIVTVDGDGIAEPANLRVRFGTPIADLVAQCGGYQGDIDRVVVGGVMMGFAVHGDGVPVTKAINSVTALTRAAARPSGDTLPCIRCGDCATVCPATLQPQQLYWHARADQFDEAAELNLGACIECGCCDTVCPSRIPLTQYFRYAKSELYTRQLARALSDKSRQRHEARTRRLERDKLERAEKLAAKRARRGVRKGEREKAVIAEVMERAKAKKNATGQDPDDETR